MLRLALTQNRSLLLVGIALWTIGGCSRPATQSPIIPVISSPETSSTRAPVPEATPTQISEATIYKQAMGKATSAQNLSQSALSLDDWNLVASRWQQAIDELKTLTPASPYRAIAQGKLTQFEQELATAKKRANQAKAAEPGSTPGTLAGTQSLNVSSTIASAESGRVFQAKIKRRAGGTPIIDVTFNSNQTFEMIVDTGASGTVITQVMADSLGIRIIGKTKVNTASQAGVEVPLGFVESISVGNAVVKDVIVAIGNNSLDIGLLGHDFFNDYDVTVKRDVVEFRKR